MAMLKPRCSGGVFVALCTAREQPVNGICVRRRTSAIGPTTCVGCRRADSSQRPTTCDPAKDARVIPRGRSGSRPQALPSGHFPRGPRGPVAVRRCRSWCPTLRRFWALMGSGASSGLRRLGTERPPTRGACTPRLVNGSSAVSRTRRKPIGSTPSPPTSCARPTWFRPSYRRARAPRPLGSTGLHTACSGLSGTVDHRGGRMRSASSVSGSGSFTAHCGVLGTHRRRLIGSIPDRRGCTKNGCRDCGGPAVKSE